MDAKIEVNRYWVIITFANPTDECTALVMWQMLTRRFHHGEIIGNSGRYLINKIMSLRCRSQVKDVCDAKQSNCIDFQGICVCHAFLCLSH